MKVRVLQRRANSDNRKSDVGSRPWRPHDGMDSCCQTDRAAVPLQAKARRTNGSQNRPQIPAEKLDRERRIDPATGAAVTEDSGSSGYPQPLQARMAGRVSVPPAAARGSAGIPLQLRATMESAFQSDLSDVRVHPNSNKAAQIGALAFTRGSDIHFAPGLYRPHTRSGRELIGHELTHVVQQRQGRVPATGRVGGLPVNENPKLEAEADSLGARAAAHSIRPVSPVSPSAGSAGSNVVQGQWWKKLLGGGLGAAGLGLMGLRDYAAYQYYQGYKYRKNLFNKGDLEEEYGNLKDEETLPYYKIQAMYALTQNYLKNQNKDPGFYEIAEDVTGPLSLGALDFIPGFMSKLGGPMVLKETMPKLSKELFDFNMNLALSGNTVTPEDMVFEEQSHVQTFIDQMNESDPDKTFSMLQSMNKASYISRFFSGLGGGMTKEELATKGARTYYGLEDTDLNLLYQKDRMSIGWAALALKKGLEEEEAIQFIVDQLTKSEENLKY